MKEFIPPIEIGQFAPSAAAISSWLYQVWKYLQENPIPEVSDVIRVANQTAENYVETNLPGQVHDAVSAAIAQLVYSDIVSPNSTLPIYRATNDEISQADLLEAWGDGCRFAVIDDEAAFAMLNDSDVITLLPLGRVTSVNGQTGEVTLSIPTKTSDLTNDSGFITSAPVTSVNGQTGAVTVGNAQSINLAVAGWNATTKEMTVIAVGVTVDNVVFVTPDPASFDAWSGSGVRCISQSINQLTFYCDTIPQSALSANIVYL